jgi:hypothetical protein
MDSNNVMNGNCALADATERAVELSRMIDDYVFVLKRDDKDDFEISIINGDFDDRNLLLLFYAGEELYY